MIAHICPTFNKPQCGIGRYSRYLYGAIKQETEEQQVVLEDGLNSIHHLLLVFRPRICHLQLEYGFCSPERIMLVDEYCRKYNARFFITYHTLAHVPHNSVGQLVTRLAHTRLASKYGEFQMIKSGIPKVIPCTDQALAATIGKDTFDSIKQGESFLFFGQAHPHKQLFETLLAVQARPEKLLACIVSKPVSGDASYYAKCREKAKSLRNVIWFDQFLEDDQVLGIAQLCNAALFPYQEYGSIGVSAAVKLLLNCTKLPIFCSNASHFSDLPRLGVVRYYSSIADMLDEPHMHSEEDRLVFVRNNSFTAAAKQHLSLYAGS